MEEKPRQPGWYKEPLMWLVLGLPATVVVAGLATVVIASSNPESLVSEPHEKIGFTVEAMAEGEAAKSAEADE